MITIVRDTIRTYDIPFGIRDDLSIRNTFQSTLFTRSGQKQDVAAFITLESVITSK